MEVLKEKVCEELLNENKLKRLQKIELGILKELIRICEENDLKYFVIGGTLLGAVRHKGFIPWDDDIDVAMPRADYDKFIILAQKLLKAPYGITHYSLDNNFREYILRITSDEAICYEDKAEIKEKSKVWIDILPIDAVPDNALSFKFYKTIVLIEKALLSIKYLSTIKNKSNRPLYERVAIRLFKILPIKLLINRNFVMKCLDMTLHSCDYTGSKRVGTFMGAYKFKEVVDRHYFDMHTTLKFEDIDVKCPTDYENYLTHMYGDYMKLPPVEKRIAHIADVEFCD